MRFKCFKNIFQFIKFTLTIFLQFKSFLILIKKFFIMVVSSFSSETRLPFSFNKTLFEFKPLLLKYGLFSKTYGYQTNLERLIFKVFCFSFTKKFNAKIYLLLIIFPIFIISFRDIYIFQSRSVHNSLS